MCAKSLFRLIFSFLSIFSILFLFSGCEKNVVSEAIVSEVIVTPVIFENVAFSFNIVGQAIAYDNVDLIARVEGFLEQRNFIEGRKVKKNDLLFVIEKTQYDANVTIAKSSLAAKKAELDRAVIEYNRKYSLFQKNAVSQQQVDDVTYQKAAAEANMLEAAAQLQLAELNLSYTEIRSPFDGRIGFANYSVGNLVGPSSKTLANVVRTDPMKVQFSINEKMLVDVLLEKVKKRVSNSKLKIKAVLPNGTMYDKTGKIEFTDNKINPMTGTILIRAVFENPDNILTPGQYLKVIVEDPETKKALLVPRSAIQEDQAGKFVLTVDKENKVASNHIITGGDFGGNTVVSSGLSEGELVITEGLQKVRPNSKVKIVIDKPLSEKTLESDEPSLPKTEKKEAGK
ncbi:MAG: hypothetical protein A2020_06120 [Lentisphaerae bacterium GWF2_45_14]|nr:MAG: hypothetical protein A2020_06120 [Lentisphaerae bacterium GWF2_45_14]